MLNLNDAILTIVIAQATAAAAAHPRWIAAIARAVRELQANPYIERDDHGLLIGSSSGQVYSANGVCQCTAYSFGQPCWHRAAARLIRLHDERLASAGQVVCRQPDDLCSIDAPCLAHVGAAAAYLRSQDEQCPNCCASLPYAERCPAAQISADQAQQHAAAAAALLNECFA